MCLYAHRRQRRASPGRREPKRGAINGPRGREESTGKGKKEGTRERTRRNEAKPGRCIIPPEAFRIFIVTSPT